MDRQKLVDKLGLVPGGGLSITDIQMVEWGRYLVFSCRYRTAPLNAPPDDPVDFDLVFHDCREIKYRVYAHISAHEQGLVSRTADVAELSLGHGNHRRDASILTNHFGVTISYGELVIEKDSHIYPLEE
jgi:hypothetical protein